MPFLKSILLLLFILIVFLSKSQVDISEINLNKVPQKKVREYLIEQQHNQIVSLTDIKPSVNSDSKTEGFKTQSKEYFLKDSLSKVWQHYLVTNPGDSWNGNKVSFGMLYSKKEDRIVYRDDYVSHLDTGQIVYLNLKLLKGILNLATVFEFINIDRKKRMIEFSYIDGNITEGKQRLQFTEDTKGHTHIWHTSLYKSDSAFRDRFLYPFFHEKVSNEFHRNMKKLFYKNHSN